MASATQKKCPEYAEKIPQGASPRTRGCRSVFPATSGPLVDPDFYGLRGPQWGVLGVLMAARASGARNLCFRVTLPDDPAQQVGYPLLDPSQWPDCTYCVYQLEIGDETSRLHYQGYVEFTGKKRYGWVQNNCEGMEGAHLEVRRGTMEEARNYAMKHETRLDGPWEWGAPKPGAGSRSDLIAVKRALDQGQPMAYVADNFFGTFLRYQRGLKEYKRIKMPKRDWPMEIIAIIGPSGTGKTRWMRDNCGDDVYWKDKSKWWDDYDGHHTVGWDEFYGHCCPFTLLLQILDRYPLKVECKGSFVEFTSRRIIFTTNQEPEQWYNAERTHQMSWAQNPLKRRLDEFATIYRTGAVHQGPAANINWNGIQYVNLMPPTMGAAEVIEIPDLDNPNQFNFE